MKKMYSSVEAGLMSIIGDLAVWYLWCPFEGPQSARLPLCLL